MMPNLVFNVKLCDVLREIIQTHPLEELRRCIEEMKKNPAKVDKAIAKEFQLHRISTDPSDMAKLLSFIKYYVPVSYAARKGLI